MKRKALRRSGWYAATARVIWDLLVLYEVMDEKLDSTIQEERGARS